MDCIEKSMCRYYSDNHRGINYDINGNIICVDKSLPEDIVLNYKLLIEIFSFCSNEGEYTRCNFTKLTCRIDTNCVLTFYISEFDYMLRYVLRCDYKHSSVSFSSEKFDYIIRYLEKYFPQLKTIPMQKLVIDE
jgi:hypothetical protein